MWVCFLQLFYLRPFNPLKWALNTNPTSFWDTLYIIYCYLCILYSIHSGADQIYSTTERLLPGTRDWLEIFTEILGVMTSEYFPSPSTTYFCLSIFPFTDIVMRCPTVCLKQPSRRSWRIVSVLRDFTMKVEPTPWRWTFNILQEKTFQFKLKRIIVKNGNFL